MAQHKTEHDYEIDDAVRTLTRAEEIKHNKKLLDAATKKMKAQMQDMSNILGIKGSMMKDD